MPHAPTRQTNKNTAVLPSENSPAAAPAAQFRIIYGTVMENKTPIQPEAAQTPASALPEAPLSAPAQNAETGVPKHVFHIFWGALALATLAGMLIPSLAATTPEYVVEQYLMLALAPVLAYVLYKVV